MTDILGLDWASAHEEAHRLEHALSDTVAERLWASMGQPGSCPHGNPIPPPGALPTVEGPCLRLRDVDTGRPVTLIRISELAEDHHELIVFFQEKRFRPGVSLIVTDRAPINGPLTVEVDGLPVALSEELAAYLWVRPDQIQPAAHAEAAAVAAGRA